MFASRSRRLAPVVALLLLAQLVAAAPLLAEPPATSARAVLPDGRLHLDLIIKFEGIIQQCIYPLPATWVIGDLAVVVTARTTIVAPGVVPAPNDYALVTAQRRDGVLYATRIVLCSEENPGARAIEFRGPICAFPPGPSYLGLWTVGAVFVQVTLRSRLDGIPVLGYYAHVVGWLTRERRVEASRVSVLDPDEEQARFEFQGTIQSWLSARVALLTISGITGLVNDSTQIDGQLRIGAAAAVRGRRLPDGQFHFEHVSVLPDAQRQVRLRGPIQSLDATQGLWDVAGVRVLLDELTYLDLAHGRPAAGMWADVVGLQRGDMLYALRVCVERPE